MPEVMSRTLVFVIGTRAQLIKVAPVIAACEKKGLSSLLFMTGQHQETMQDLIEEFGISSPQVSVAKASEHATIFSLFRWLPAAYYGIGARLRETCGLRDGVDVLVHGDTLSTLVGAAAGRRFGARIIHLESGLSSNKLFDPFPEELCRRLVFRMTDVAMCPNAQAASRMALYKCSSVINTEGNTIVDAVAMTGASLRSCGERAPYVIASLHRFQNIYNTSRLRHLVVLIEAISRQIPVHFVLHPATRKRLDAASLMSRLASAPGVLLSPRMGYGDFLRMAAQAACVLTDGGSNQEELATLGVPTIVMRSHTERSDGLGVNTVMESDVTGGVERFILDGSYLKLRRPAVATTTEGPSSRVASFLAGSRLGQ
jgi:UDP-N-acetylglucosamine 2-epimerase (non-hydrolysing)